MYSSSGQAHGAFSGIFFDSQGIAQGSGPIGADKRINRLGRCSYEIEEKIPARENCAPLRTLTRSWILSLGVGFRKQESIRPEKRTFCSNKDRLWQGVRSNARIFSVMSGI